MPTSVVSHVDVELYPSQLCRSLPTRSSLHNALCSLRLWFCRFRTSILIKACHLHTRLPPGRLMQWRSPRTLARIHLLEFLAAFQKNTELIQEPLLRVIPQQETLCACQVSQSQITGGRNIGCNLSPWGIFLRCALPSSPRLGELGKGTCHIG